MQRRMEAGAGIEDLRVQCPYFYEVAEKLYSQTGDQAVARIATFAFEARFKVRPARCSSAETAGLGESFVFDQGS